MVPVVVQPRPSVMEKGYWNGEELGWVWPVQTPGDKDCETKLDCRVHGPTPPMTSNCHIQSEPEQVEGSAVVCTVGKGAMTTSRLSVVAQEPDPVVYAKVHVPDAKDASDAPFAVTGTGPDQFPPNGLYPLNGTEGVPRHTVVSAPAWAQSGSTTVATADAEAVHPNTLVTVYWMLWTPKPALAGWKPNGFV